MYLDRHLTRRKMITSLLQAGACSLLPGTAFHASAQTAYAGKLLMTVQLVGGLDVTSFCDPKTNVLGERKINNWADSAGIKNAGNLQYAPFADNAAFFAAHYGKTLVINGVDAQTNSHTAGIMHNWSGRNVDGYPSITALLAATVAPDLPLSYINFGGFNATSGIITPTRIGNTTQLRSLIFPNAIAAANSTQRILDNDLAQIQLMHWQTMNAKLADPGLTAGNLKNRESFRNALEQAEGLKAFGDLIPDAEAIQQQRTFFNGSSTLHQQIQIALLAFKSGVSIAADVVEFGYDTHDNHDAKHEPLLANSTDALDFLWDYAEELGLADRLLVVVGSDFGRTPFYNGGAGKDHWPIGSYLVMEKNAGYTNQVIGETDAGHNAYPISTSTLKRNDSSGVILRPPHVHKALRKYLGIESASFSRRFQFDAIEDFDFFG